MKILAGVHVGAEVTLSNEEATLGRDDGCDFVLEDAGLAGRHIRLSAGTEVRMTVLGGISPVHVDGRIVEGTIELGAYQVVSMGGLSLAVGPADQDWPPIDLPPPPGPEGRPLPDEASEHEGLSEDIVEKSPATDVPSAADSSDPVSVPEAGRRSSSVLARAAGIVVAALVAITAIVWVLEPRQVQPEHAGPEETAREIEEIASRFGAVIQVEVGNGTDGPITVTGNIDTTQNRSRLLAELTKAKVHATVHITSTEEIAESITSVLDHALNENSRNSVSVLPVEGSPGELTVFGYVEDEPSLTRARSLVERDVKEYIAVNYEVQTRADRLSILRRRLDELKLGTSVQIQETPDGVGLFGPVHTADELARIVELVDRFNDEFDSRPMLKLSGTDSFLGESTINLDIRAVVLGESVHVVLHDGESYREGSKVEGRYIVKTITDRYMILEKAKQLIDDTVTDGPDVAYFIFDAT